MTQDEIYMGEAIKQAKRAYRREETPIGCVIVYQDKIIARGYNKTNSDFGKKNRILDKQTAPFEAIKHQRDKQIFIVYRAGIQLFNLNKGY